MKSRGSQDSTGNAAEPTVQEALHDELRRREGRFERLIELVECGFIAGEFIRGADNQLLDLRCLDVNSVWEEITGVNRDRIVGHTIQEVMPELAAEWLLYLDELASRGQPVKFCRYLTTSDRWFEVQAVQPFPNEFCLLFTDATETRKAYRLLEDSEIDYKYAVELNPSVSWTATPDGTLIRVSRRWTEWTGLAGLGDPWAAAIHPDDLQPNIDLWTQCVQENRAYESRLRIKMRDGTYRWMRVRALPLRNHAGDIVKWYGTTDDIHDSYLAESALRELNAVLEERMDEAIAVRNRLWDNSPDLQVAVDLAGHLRAINPACKDILGYEPDELIGANYLEPIHPDDRDTAQRLFEEAFRHGHPASELRIRAKDGSYRYMTFVASPPENGLIYSSGRDTTAERKAISALREAEARIRSIFETSYQLQGYLLPDGTIVDVNAASLKAIDAERDAVLGKPLWETPWFTETPGLPDLVRLAVQEVATGQHYREEVSVILLGERKTYDFLMRPVTDQVGGVIGIISEAIDLTERRAAEQKVAQLQKMETIGQLTGGIAHDFNNLLTPILGAIELLRRRYADDNRVQRLTGGALQAAERARTLIQRLLAFSRRQHLEARPVDIRQLIESMVELLTRSLGPGVEITPRFAEELPPAKVDPNQLELAILNLAINARDAMSGSGKLSIKCEEYLAEGRGQLRKGRYVQISLHDTGIGMKPEILNRAIEPFFTTKGIGQGTGLGLSMVYGLAVQSGGDFALSSAPGQGTTACLRLPVATELPARPEPPQPSAVVRAPRRYTLLLVDDENLVRASTTDMLAELGYDVLDADSGSRALEMVKSGLKPDVLVTDVAMPGMSGAELAREMQDILPGLPVLLISGYANVERQENYPRLAKPFGIAELSAAVWSTIGGTIH